MKKMTIKKQRTMLISAMLVACVILVGAIYIKVIKEEPKADIVINKIDTSEPVVYVIEAPEEESLIVEVHEIKINETKEDIYFKVTEEAIEEPIAEEPEKPDNTPPEHNPETSDDVEDMIKEPEYVEEEVVYVPDELVEVDPVIEHTTEPEQNNADDGNDLVPDSENPFANPSNVGVPDEINGSDLGDGEWGTGDKF